MNYTKHFECGCKVVVIGEITNAQIVKCPKHKSAPDLYEALMELCSLLSVNCSMDYLYKHDLSLPLSKGQQALAKAENK